MRRFTVKKGLLTLAVTIMAFALLWAVGCAPTSQASNEQSMGSNDTVVVGDLDRYSPGGASGAETGPAMDIDEEMQLQQDKITGGADGAITSTNIVPLDPGITAYPEADPVGFVGRTGIPATVPHGTTNGTECLSCHSTGEQEIPQSHVLAKITNGQCASCHQGLS
jgi:hypothetical protein